MYFLVVLVLCTVGRKISILNNLITYQLQQQVKHYNIQNPLIDIRQVEYLIPVQVGSRKQNIKLIIDTGSSDLWVPTKGAYGFSRMKDKKLYDCDRSTTCVKTDDRIYINYDDGPISGVIAWDQVCLQRCKYHLQNQSLVLIDQADGNMQNNPGIMGLSFQKLSQNRNPTILQTMVNDGLIRRKVFSIYLTDVGRNGSAIVFGGYDNQYKQNQSEPVFNTIISKFIYVPLISTSSYKIKLLGLNFTDKLFKIKVALVDSGTSCFTIPYNVIDRMMDRIQSKWNIHYEYRKERYSPSYSQVYFYSNHTDIDQLLGSFPLLHVAISKTKTLTLTPQDYLYKYSYHQMVCVSKLERSEQDDLLILGDAFLQSFYTIFDQDKLQLGFVHSINNGTMGIQPNQTLFQQESSFGLERFWQNISLK